MRCGQTHREEPTSKPRASENSLAYNVWTTSVSSVIWQDHYGHTHPDERRAWPYKFIARCMSGVIAVSEPLARWSQSKLGVPANRVWYIPNFVSNVNPGGKSPDLPGKAGARIVCVAHFRPQKDHFTLLQAMAMLINQVPAAHLNLVGGSDDGAYLERVKKEIIALGLSHHVSILGQRTDVSAILRLSDIGVLSSSFEGLPFALLEYGRAGLPAVVTRVGQCAEVLEEGRSGILVPPSSPQEMADALIALLQSAERRKEYGVRLHTRIQGFYDSSTVIDQICQVYEKVLPTACINSDQAEPVAS